MAEGQWVRKSNREDTEREHRASHMGLHPGADLVKERRQGSF